MGKKKMHGKLQAALQQPLCTSQLEIFLNYELKANKAHTYLVLQNVASEVAIGFLGKSPGQSD